MRAVKGGVEVVVQDDPVADGGGLDPVHHLAVVRELDPALDEEVGALGGRVEVLVVARDLRRGEHGLVDVDVRLQRHQALAHDGQDGVRVHPGAHLLGDDLEGAAFLDVGHGGVDWGGRVGVDGLDGLGERLGQLGVVDLDRARGREHVVAQDVEGPLPAVELVVRGPGLTERIDGETGVCRGDLEVEALALHMGRVGAQLVVGKGGGLVDGHERDVVPVKRGVGEEVVLEVGGAAHVGSADDDREPHEDLGHGARDASSGRLRRAGRERGGTCHDRARRDGRLVNEGQVGEGVGRACRTAERGECLGRAVGLALVGEQGPLARTGLPLGLGKRVERRRVLVGRGGLGPNLLVFLLGGGLLL